MSYQTDEFREGDELKCGGKNVRGAFTAVAHLVIGREVVVYAKKKAASF